MDGSPRLRLTLTTSGVGWNRFGRILVKPTLGVLGRPTRGTNVRDLVKRVAYFGSLILLADLVTRGRGGSGGGALPGGLL